MNDFGPRIEDFQMPTKKLVAAYLKAHKAGEAFAARHGIMGNNVQAHRAGDLSLVLRQRDIHAKGGRIIDSTFATKEEAIDYLDGRDARNLNPNNWNR